MFVSPSPIGRGNKSTGRDTYLVRSTYHFDRLLSRAVKLLSRLIDELYRPFKIISNVISQPVEIILLYRHRAVDLLP